jgi:hypothetical protein
MTLIALQLRMTTAQFVFGHAAMVELVRVDKAGVSETAFVHQPDTGSVVIHVARPAGVDLSAIDESVQPTLPVDLAGDVAMTIRASGSHRVAALAMTGIAARCAQKLGYRRVAGVERSGRSSMPPLPPHHRKHCDE